MLFLCCLDLPITRRDRLRFVRSYTGRLLRKVLRDNGEFPIRVERRALALYNKGRREGLMTNRFVPDKHDD